MMETIDRPPRTVMEVFKILPEGTLAEVIDDRLYMSPQRSAVHQRVLLLVASSLILYVEASELGEVIISPFDVYLDELSNVVQPDIVYVSKENASITQDHIHGVPDLLVEILLPENKKYDKQQKKDLYERFGVKEYWIIDPSNKEAIGYTLLDGKYNEFFKASGKIESKLLNASFSF